MWVGVGWNGYFIQNSITIYKWRSCIKSRTLKIKSHIHTLKFYRNWLKFIEDDCMTGTYSMQSSVTRIAGGPYIKNRTLEIKSRVHTVKFIEIDWIFFEVTQYDCQLLCVKLGKTYIIFFLKKISFYWVAIVWLLVYYLDWVGVWWWWFGIKWSE